MCHGKSIQRFPQQLYGLILRPNEERSHHFFKPLMMKRLRSADFIEFSELHGVSLI
jgi:hypothetical protein